MYLEDTLKRNLIFFTGKGGVGKTSIAMATAHLLAKEGKRTTLVHWNELGGTTYEHTQEGLRILELDALSCFREYCIRILKFETLYKALLDNKIVHAFTQAAPGLAETVLAGKIVDLVERGEQDCLLVDLPASGHSVSFFKSPIGIEKIFGFGFIHKEAKRIVETFKAATTRLDIVTLPAELPCTEAVELKKRLTETLPFPFGFLHINQELPQLKSASEDSEMLSERYRTDLESQKEALATLEPIGMDAIRTPHFFSPQFKGIVDSMTDHLGKQ